MTPTEAREITKTAFGPSTARTVIAKLADQVEALTKERDELQKQVDDFCMNYRMRTDVESKKLTQERDALAAAAKLAIEALMDSSVARDKFRAGIGLIEKAGVQ